MAQAKLDDDDEPLGQPEQKPVAWLPTSEWRDPPHAMLYFNPTASQRPWVGLTDEDYKSLSDGGKLVAMWAEAKLKERNT